MTIWKRRTNTVYPLIFYVHPNADSASLIFSLQVTPMQPWRPLPPVSMPGLDFLARLHFGVGKQFFSFTLCPPWGKLLEDPYLIPSLSPGSKWDIPAQEVLDTFMFSHPASLVAQQQRTCPPCRTREFNPWVRNIPWRRKWQPTPVFSAGESHGQRSLVGYSPWGDKESDMTKGLKNNNNVIPLYSDLRMACILILLKPCP